MKTTLVVPCYNEEKRIQSEEFKRLALSNSELSLVFVNDGSTDATLRVLEELRTSSLAHVRVGETHNLTNKIEVFSLKNNCGKSEAVRQGLLIALRRGAEAVGYTDADLATPVDEILRQFNEFKNSTALMLMASRVKTLGANVERKASRHYLGRVFATFASLALRLAVYDTQCGLKFFRRHEALDKALANKFFSRWAFDVELIARLLKYGLKPKDLLEVPVKNWQHVSGSKLGPLAMLKAGLDLFFIALWIRKK